MGTLNKALRCLFEHALGALPAYEESAWRDACAKVFEVVASSAGSTPQQGISWRDLYSYFSREVEGGASAKAVDALFNTLDRSSNGLISVDEFTEVVLKRLSSLRNEKQLEEQLAQRVPRVHVVPGSNRLNCLAGVQAFRVACVTRGWVRSLGSVWREMDADHDGRCNLADMRRYFSRVQPRLLPFISSIFRAVEGGARTGSISFQQFLRALYPEATSADLHTLVAMSTDSKSRAATAAAAAADDKLLAEIQGVFAVFDDDRSGELDEDEFLSAMELTGHTRPEAKGMFKAIDTDHSGLVSWDEFRIWYTSNYSRYMDEAARRMLDENGESPFGYVGA